MFEPPRRDDWPSRLNLAVRLHRAGEFEWGQYDCATLFSDVAFAMTDADPLAAFGAWRSEIGALRCLARTGCTSVRGYLDTVLPIIQPAQVRRGDAGYVAGADGALVCPAIVTGSEAISRNADGWVVVSISDLTHAYRIGR